MIRVLNQIAEFHGWKVHIWWDFRFVHVENCRTSLIEMKESTQKLLRFTTKYLKTLNLVGIPISIARFLTLVDTLRDAFRKGF